MIFENEKNLELVCEIEGWLVEPYIKLGELVHFENFREILGEVVLFL